MSRKLLITGGVILIIIGGLYFWISKRIDEYRMADARRNSIISYAGCEMKALNPDDMEPKGSYATMESVLDRVNKNWEMDSQRNRFNYTDVVEYMMKYCPPKSDSEIERIYSGQNVEGWKRSRDYQLKFINRDIDVFRE